MDILRKVTTGSADVTKGDSRASFPSTIWEAVQAAGDPDRPEHREQLNAFCKDYWKPVFAYIRASWRKPPEEAKDLTQAFFAKILEKGYLARVRPEGGSFRGYLKQALKHFLIDAGRSELVRKPVQPLFEIPADELDRVAPADAASADEVYDREWLASLLDAGLRELQELLSAKGKKVYADLLKASFVDQPKPTRPELATRFGISESDVRNHLAYARTVLRRILQERIQRYAGTSAEAAEEWRRFFGS